MPYNRGQDSYLSHHHLHYPQQPHHQSLSPPILQQPLPSQRLPHLHPQDHYSSHPDHLHLPSGSTTLAPLPSLSATPLYTAGPSANNPPVLPPAPSQIPMPHQPSTNLPPRHRAIKWVSKDDAKLLDARAEGKNWQQIQDEHFPTKTPNACRKRHERLIEGRRGEEWTAEDLEHVGRAYAESRKHFWSPIAAALGQNMDWKAVEKKVFEKGPKAMLALSRALTRREREVDGDMDLDDEADEDDSTSGV